MHGFKSVHKMSLVECIFEPTVLPLTHSAQKEQMDHRIRNLIFFVDKSQNTTHKFQKVRGSGPQLLARGPPKDLK